MLCRKLRVALRRKDTGVITKPPLFKPDPHLELPSLCQAPPLNIKFSYCFIANVAYGGWHSLKLVLVR